MADHVGILSSGHTERHSGVRAAEWLGVDMSKFWLQEELGTFLRQLEDAGTNGLHEYSYRAHLFSGELMRFTVNAHLIIWGDIQCRMVEPLTVEPG